MTMFGLFQRLGASVATLACLTVGAGAGLGCGADRAESSGEAASGDERASGVSSVSAENLWAGSPSVTIERWAPDPCNEGRTPVDVTPIGYDSWARTRASIRNLCFEVWRPGVTDTDNPDFWRLLDVQVHYRKQGQTDWTSAYVDSLDRRGNNRRYAFDIGWGIDPLPGYNLADANASFEIVSESATTALLKSTTEVYFTVNGHALKASNGEPFRIDYFAHVERPSFEPVSDGTSAVLHPTAECRGLRAGTGAGAFAVDVTDQSAIEQLLGGDALHAASMALTGEGESRVLSIYFSDQLASDLPLPYYRQGYREFWRAEAAPLSETAIEVRAKIYDRQAKERRVVSVTFEGCSRR